MKAEINNENKEKFFAQYWGQNLLSSDMHGDGGTVYSLTMKTDSLNGKSLKLKSITEISEEEGLEIVKSGLTIEFFEKGWRTKDTLIFFDYKIHMVDYLRAIGYAMPWMGLSVDEMVEAGWIKLQEKR